jgi:hypothetical protein
MGRIITLATDFGLKDHYVGAMKGVILSINPDAILTDITHEIPPHSIFDAAFTLMNFYRYFPVGTIHVVVVDPGVGGKRKPIAVEADGNFFVGPDNGVFTFVYRLSKRYRAYKITDSKYVLSRISNTFHGRDIFAPAAAHLSLGVPVEDLGKKVGKPVTLEIKEPVVRGEEIIGEFIHVDSFGNLVTNIPSNLIKGKSKIHIGRRVVEGVSKSYSDVSKGELLAIIGSSGFLEISMNQGRASDVIGMNEALRVKNEE